MALIDFDSRFGHGDDLLRELALAQPSSVGDLTLPAAGLVSGGPVAVARVDHGRWIADCPTEGCGGAEFVSISSSHGFFCCECRNAATGHVPIPVVLPDAKTRTQIDTYLSARPVPGTRNWSPRETVKDLQRENREHGVRIS